MASRTVQRHYGTVEEGVINSRPMEGSNVIQELHAYRGVNLYPKTKLNTLA